MHAGLLLRFSTHLCIPCIRTIATSKIMKSDVGADVVTDNTQIDVSKANLSLIKYRILNKTSGSASLIEAIKIPN